MSAVVVALKSRWAVAWADPRVRRRAFHLFATVASLCVGKAISKLCAYSPSDFEGSCHLAGRIVERLLLLMGR